MFVSSWAGWVAGTELGKAPGCWLGSVSHGMEAEGLQ